MRIISGKYKGKRLSPPKKFPSRPTTDLAKEALFGMLDSRVYFEKLDVLDLFSGTGNISIEFLSRGVGQVVSVDNSGVSVHFQLKIAEELGDKNWHIVRQDAFNYIEHCQQKFDIIFADPPYALAGIDQLVENVLSKGVLVDDGIFVVEHSDRIDMSPVKFHQQTRNYGGVSFSFFGPIA